MNSNESPRDVLTQAGIKPTFQRLAILEEVLGDRTHPSIRALHARLVRKVPTLSKTTLYSTLELFAGKGLVSALTLNPGEIRYDGVPHPHHHFLCERCGTILDLEIDCAAGRRGEVHGHRIDEVHGHFKGVCKDCLKNRSAKATRRSIHA